MLGIGARLVHAPGLAVCQPGRGVPLADVYLEFLAGRCRPNTVLAAASDLKVFFTVVGKPPDQVRPADVLAFITARRTGRAGGAVCCSRQATGMSLAGCRPPRCAGVCRSCRGFRVLAGPRGCGGQSGAGRAADRRKRSRPGQDVALVRAAQRLPRMLSPAEVDALTAALRTHRDRAMVLGGLRRCEVLGLRLGTRTPSGRRVHRRGQGRLAAASPGVGPVVRRGGRLPGRRTASRGRYRPGLPGP
jgi:integrase/recombinase XerD